MQLKTFHSDYPIVMGILNVTPDSFYDGGRYLSETAIVKRLDEMVAEGVDIIDVGACSTRPGGELVSEKEELSRLDFALDLIQNRYPNVPLSIDTFRSGVVRDLSGCVTSFLVNDISGGLMDPHMFETVAELGLPYVLSHYREAPEEGNVFEEVTRFLSERLVLLESMGVEDIVIDPGFGFGKRLEENYAVLHRLAELRALKRPVLVGLSRKSMIYKALNITPEASLEGTTLLQTYALNRGADILRVHDVAAAKASIGLFLKLGEHHLP